MEEECKILAEIQLQEVPISCLPLDTLVEIFLLAQKLASDMLYPEDGYESRGRVTIILASVCHDWRQIVLSTPLLWRYIDFNNITWLECALERSMQVPLIVALNVCDPQRDEDIATFSTILYILNRPEYFQRIVTFYCWPLLEHPTLFDLPGKTIPVWSWGGAMVLETLDLYGVDLKLDDSFEVEFPALRSLTLRLCRFHWNKFPYAPRLRELFINQSQKEHLHIGTSKELLKILKSVPELEKLQVWDALSDDVLLEHQERVVLAHLRYIWIREELNLIQQNVYGGIVIPRTTTVRVSVESHTWNAPEEIHTPLETISVVHSSRSMAPKIFGLTADLDRDSLNLSIYDSEEMERNQEHSCFWFPSAPVHSATLLADSSNILDFSNLTTLEIHVMALEDIDAPPIISLWSSTLGQLPNLQVIRARKRAGISLVMSLYDEAKRVSTATGKESFSCRALQDLALEGPNVSRYKASHFFFALQTRSDYGHHLKRLVLYSSRAVSDEQNREDELILPRLRGFADIVEQQVPPRCC